MSGTLEFITCPRCGNVMSSEVRNCDIVVSCTSCSCKDEFEEKIKEYTAIIPCDLHVNYVWDEDKEEYLPVAANVIIQNYEVYERVLDDGEDTEIYNPRNEVEVNEKTNVQSIIRYDKKTSRREEG